MTYNGVTYSNLHWIQALTANYDTPGAGGERLDNPFTKLTSPFYDAGGAAGITAGGGSYFLDTPWKIEDENVEANPVADVQFQVVLAGLTTSTVGGVTTNTVTLFGGEGWGYYYTAADTGVEGAFDEPELGPDIATAAVPLPASAGVGFSMLCGFGVLSKIRKRVWRRFRIA